MRPRVDGDTPAYLPAVVLVAGLLAVRWFGRHWFDGNVPYLQFFPAILVAAWYGGLGPGLLATALSLIAAAYFFLPPDGFAVNGIPDLMSLLFFAAIGIGISGLNHQLRRTAKLLGARAERLDAIINTSADGIIVIDDHCRIEAFNQGAERLFAYPEAEVLGRNVSVLMPAPHHEDHDRYVKRFLDTGEARIIGKGREVIGRRRDGTTFPLHLSVGEMRIDGQRKFTGLLHDLTRRTQLSTELRTSEARWKAIVDAAVDGIVVIDARGRVETFNPAAERLFGYAAGDVIGRNVDMLMPSPYREDHDTYLTRYLATGRAKVIGAGRQVKGLRKDGSTFPLHLSVGEISLQGERKFIGILHDLSERVGLEEQLREQAALAKLGEMAAVVAHEVKNPLAGIRGAMQVLSRQPTGAATTAHIIREIIARIDALDQMMKDILLFARPPQPRRSTTDLVPLVTLTANLLTADPALMDVDVQIEGSAPAVAVDPEMLRIVFQNLLLNGAHAMHGKGRIRVAVGTADSSCSIAFTDSGPGIPADIRDQIFTPFFTTKSRGTGLGLPTVKRLIEAHSGQITIDCPTAGGTSVIVHLPISLS
jgi:two-component system sensor kinase FixL